jgi:hypothetical protein
MIGSFGDVVFETSDTRILTFSGFKLDASARYGSHELIGLKPRTEYLGPGLLQVSFTITLNGALGVKPREEMESWVNYAEIGQAEYLILGGKPVGENLWIVKSVSQAWDTIWSAGELYSGKIDVSLEEYIND